MGLTGSGFLWLCRLLLIGAVALVVWGWRHAARPGPWAVVQRLAALTVVSLLAIVNVAVPLNDEYQWYISFADLAADLHGGNAPDTTSTNYGVAAADVLKDAHGGSLEKADLGPRAAMKLKLTTADGGGYEIFDVPGPASGYTGKVAVWFPPSYPRTGAAPHDFPVVEAFHGYPTAPLSYLHLFHIGQAVVDNAAARKMRESLVVIPYWSPNAVDTECVDGPNLKMDTWVTRDVPEWVRTHLYAAGGRSSWAALGYSAGGYCALMAPMRHPETYGAGISLSGYAHPDFSPGYQPFAKGSPEFEAYDLARIARTKPPAVALWTFTTKDDALSYSGTEALTKEARKPMAVTSITLPAGGHRVSLWVPYVPLALAWLGTVSPGFAATTAAG